jgi:predicted nucleic acid-binding Zn ribbon protein
MKKCIVCGKGLDKDEEEFCETCISFFKWKYKKRFWEMLRFHKLFAETSEKRENKFRRKK